MEEANVATQKKSLNVGLNLLRILLTFGVVLDHFWWTATPEDYTGVRKALWHLRTLAVPAFMTMTFFFTANRFRFGDVPWLKKHFLRLYEPFVFWALVYFAVRLVVARFDAWYDVGLADLLWQLALGSSERLCMQFWFHGDLIILTALFFVAFRAVSCAKANFYLALGAVALGFTLQYTPLNDAMFGWMPFGAKYPLGRLAAMLPYAGAGFLLAAIKDRLAALTPGMKVSAALFGLWLAWLVVYRDVCPRPHSEVGYAGLQLNLTAWGIFFAFYYLPFDKMPAAFLKVVLGVSKYCMGVYCIHLLLGQLVFDFVFKGTKTATKYGELRIFTVVQCIVVWVLSYVLCWLIAKIPVKFFKRVVE